MLTGLVSFFLSLYIARSTNNCYGICAFLVLFEFGAKLCRKITGYFYFLARQYANKLDVLVIYFTNSNFQKFHCLFKKRCRFLSQKRKKQTSSEHVKIWQPMFFIIDHFFHNGPVLMPRKSCNALPGDL